MGIGTSLFLIAVGAILYFAVDADISGLEIQTIGLILMVVGVIGLVISLFFLSSLRRGTSERRREPFARRPWLTAAGRVLGSLLCFAGDGVEPGDVVERLEAGVAGVLGAVLRRRDPER